jgi:hypothetical protein
MPAATPVFTVVQQDRETVAVRRFNAGCRLRYALLLDGEYLPATSVVVTASDESDAADGPGFTKITAHFITATVTDHVRPTADGFQVQRRWDVIPSVPVAALFTVEVEPPTVAAGGQTEAATALRYVAPGCCAGRIDAQTLCGVTTEELASPLVAIHSESWSLAIASEGGPQRESLTIHSLGAASPGRAAALLRVDFRLPAAAAPPRPLAETSVEGEDWLPAVANRRLERRYLVTITQPGALTHHVANDIFHRPDPAERPSRQAFAHRLKTAVAGVLSSHLLEKGAICGLRVHADDGKDDTIPWLSAAAGVGVAAAVLADAEASETHETALRMIDFALRGQHPSGVFYDRFDPDRMRWRGLDRRANPPRIAMLDACRTSRFLRLAAASIAHAGAAVRMQRAWQRFAAGFVAGGRLAGAGAVITPDRVIIEPGMEALALVGEVEALAVSGYRPPGVRSATRLPALARELLLLHVGEGVRDGDLPSARRNEPTSAAVLELGEALLVAGAAPTSHAAWLGGDYYGAAANLLSWMATGSRGHGGLVDSVRRPRLLSSGNRLAFVLMQLGQIAAAAGDAETPRLYRAAATAALRFSASLPLGTGFVVGSPPHPGRVDSRVVASEVMYGTLLMRHHHELFRD